MHNGHLIDDLGCIPDCPDCMAIWQQETEAVQRWTSDDTAANAAAALAWWEAHQEETLGYQTRGSVQDFACGPLALVLRTHTLTSPEEIAALIEPKPPAVPQPWGNGSGRMFGRKAYPGSVRVGRRWQRW